MNVKELAAISSTLAPVIRDVVTREVAAQVKAIVPAVGPKGDAGERGEKGADGKDGERGPEGPAGRDAIVDLDDLALKAASLIPTPKDGSNGADGRPGKDADPEAVAALLFAQLEKSLDEKLALLVDVAVTKAVASLPMPKDGLNGKDGLDGKDGRDGLNGKDGADGRDGVGLAGSLVSKDGHLVITLSNGDVKDLGPVVGEKGADGLRGKDGAPGRDGIDGKHGSDGKDGAPGKDGSDGLGFDDLIVVQDSERSFSIKAVRGERVKEIGKAEFPVEIYRGVFVEGKTYERGDGVTWGGSEWHCNESTSSRPGDGSKAWTLKVKRGRDGKDGKDAPSVPVVSIKR